MRLVPLRYPLRSLLVRWSSALFSSVGIGLTVAVFGAVLALRDGFDAVVRATGSEGVLVFLRVGARTESDSVVRHPTETAVLRTRPEILRDERGVAVAAAESVLGVRFPRLDGSGTSIVTVRGVEPASFDIQGERWRLVEGRRPRFGTDEVVVGRPLSRRLRGFRTGESIELNVTPFRIVGVFEHDGAYSSEVWGDVHRIAEATRRPAGQRLVARRAPGTDVGALRAELEGDRRAPMTVQTEREHYAAQSSRLGGVLSFLAGVLAALMGSAAALGAVNTMVAAVGARSREVGVLAAMGFTSRAVFVSFLVESAVIGVVGGLAGALLVLPLGGLETATLNWNTLTDVDFAFRVTPALLAKAAGLALVLGLLGGAAPAWRAARIPPTAALRRL
jgi:putative ABC transport system permease protein